MEEIEGACPFCKGPVKGDDDIKYYCKKCNFLFRREDLSMEENNEDETQGTESGSSG